MKIEDLFDAVREKVFEIAIFEELFDEIENADKTSSPMEILTKLRLIILSKPLTEVGKTGFLSIIQTFEGHSLFELQMLARVLRVEMVENKKQEVEPMIEELLVQMENSDNDLWQFYLDIAKYFEDFGLSRFQFIKTINERLIYSGMLKKDGLVVSMDTDTIFESLKNTKNHPGLLPNDDLPGTSGRGKH